VGDWVEVTWCADDEPMQCWKGRLTARRHTAWSIEYDFVDRVLTNIIPKPGVEFFSVVKTSPPASASPVVPAAQARPTPAAPAVPAPLRPAPAGARPAAPAPILPPVGVAPVGPVRAAPRPISPLLAPAALPASSARAPPFVPTPAVSNPSASTPPPLPPLPAAFSTRRGRPAIVSVAPLPALPADADFPGGTGIPEVDELYNDMHLSKNVPLPGSLTRYSGDIPAKDLLPLLAEQEVRTAHPIYKGQFAPTTSASHLRSLRWLLTHLPVSDTPIATAIPHTVGLHARARGWAPTTWLTSLNNIHGALAALFIYRPSQVSISMSACPQWTSHMKAVVRLKPLHKPNQPLAITKEEMDLALQREPRPEVRALLECAWLTAARGNDARQLLADDFNFPAPTAANPTQTMAVTFRRGKTAKKDQYTVGAPLPSQQTLDHINQRKVAGSWAFPGVSGDHIRDALRRVNPLLEQRSIRRGYLQYLASLGWRDQQLLEVSRHASVQMLRRYLDMGVVSSTTHETAVHATRPSASL